MCDLGNVLVQVDRAPTIRKLAGNLGVAPDALRPFFNSDDLHEDLELGEITPDQFVMRLLDALQPDSTPSIREIEDIMGQSFQLNRELKEHIDAHREHVQVIILSNTNALDIAAIERSFSLISWADAAVLSYEIHLKKPDSRIYHHTLDEYKLMPAHTFFLDDRPENIQAARDVGIRAEVFESTAQAIHSIDKFLANPVP